MAITEKQLLELKERVEEAKSKVSELKGRRDYLMQQLTDEFGCKTVEQAEKKIAGLEKDIQDLQERQDKLTQKLEIQLEEIEAVEDLGV